MIIHIKVHAQAKQSRVIAYENDYLKIQLNAVPEKGKANKALIKLLAKQAGIAQENIHIRQGSQSKFKHLEISDNSEPQFAAYLESLQSS